MCKVLLKFRSVFTVLFPAIVSLLQFGPLLAMEVTAQHVKPPRLHRSAPNHAVTNRKEAFASGFLKEVPIGSSHRGIIRGTKALLKSKFNIKKSWSLYQKAHKTSDLRNDMRYLTKTTQENLAKASTLGEIGVLHEGAPAYHELHKSLYFAERAQQSLGQNLDQYESHYAKSKVMNSDKKNVQLGKEIEDARRFTAESGNQIESLKKRVGEKQHEEWLRKNQANLEIQLDRHRTNGQHAGTVLNAAAEATVMVPVAVFTGGALAPSLGLNGANAVSKISINEVAHQSKARTWKNPNLIEDERQEKLQNTERHTEWAHTGRKLAVGASGAGIGIAGAVDAVHAINGTAETASSAPAGDGISQAVSGGGAARDTSRALLSTAKAVVPVAVEGIGLIREARGIEEAVQESHENAVISSHSGKRPADQKDFPSEIESETSPTETSSFASDATLTQELNAPTRGPKMGMSSSKKPSVVKNHPPKIMVTPPDGAGKDSSGNIPLDMRPDSSPLKIPLEVN